MTPSAPSPSAQELADVLKDALAGDQTAGVVILPKSVTRKIEKTLRRLSETERERDAAERAHLKAESERDEAQRVAVNYRNEIRALRDERNAAEAERDALREMLAQADAVIEFDDSGSDHSDLPLDEWAAEAIERHRHRLSQKGSAS